MNIDHYLKLYYNGLQENEAELEVDNVLGVELDTLAQNGVGTSVPEQSIQGRYIWIKMVMCMCRKLYVCVIILWSPWAAF